jgi:hypothetical protein
MRTFSASAASVLILLASCDAAPGSGPAVVEPLTPPLPGEGFQLSMSVTVPAGAEAWRCEIVSGLPVGDGSVFQFVNRAESRQTAGIHHADVATLFYTGLEIEPGQYDCDDLYTQHTELMEEAIVVYASQLPDDGLLLPENTAAQLPVNSLYMFELHYVNVSDEPVEVVSYLNAYTIAGDDVEQTIYGNVNRDVDIAVPPATAQHTEWTRCLFNRDADVIFLSGHTHELATMFTIRHFDGENVGDVVYQNDDWHAPPVLRLDPPLKMKAGTGFEYACDYASSRDAETTWGFRATDEMCQFGYVFVPGDTDILCETVATSDGLGVPAP